MRTCCWISYTSVSMVCWGATRAKKRVTRLATSKNLRVASRSCRQGPPMSRQQATGPQLPGHLTERFGLHHLGDTGRAALGLRLTHRYASRPNPIVCAIQHPLAEVYCHAAHSELALITWQVIICRWATSACPPQAHLTSYHPWPSAMPLTLEPFCSSQVPPRLTPQIKPPPECPRAAPWRPQSPKWG